jgi:magnesium chelatase family protein
VSLIAEKGCLIAGHLQEVCAWLEGRHELSEPEECDDVIADAPEDLSEIMGQEQGNGRWRLRPQVDTIFC